MDCQLEGSTGVAEAMPWPESLALRVTKWAARAKVWSRRAWTEPAAFRAALERKLTGTSPATPPPPGGPPARPRKPPLGLEPGERVRVRSIEEIRATLDEQGRCRGLAYMPEMARFAGRELVVRKRVERFFDERTREMRKARGVVILDGAHCEGKPSDPWDYGGCDRACFLFWKEDWLERVRP